MAYTPVAVANEFVERYGKERGIEHMKLQKLTYYAYGWWLAFEDDPLMIEGPEVWKFGPVFSSLYNVLAPFGSKPINEAQRAVPWGETPRVRAEDEHTLSVLDWIWKRYGGASSFTLSDETHKPGTPWQLEAERKGYNVPRHHRIPDTLIKECFKAEAAKLEVRA